MYNIIHTLNHNTKLMESDKMNAGVADADK